MATKPAVKAKSVKSTLHRHSIMIVDDHYLIRKGLSDLINEEPDMTVTQIAESSAQALAMLKQELPDLLILDLSLPGVDGLNLLQMIICQYPGLLVLVLSIHEERLYAERVVRAGAMGYIMKNEPVEKLLEAVRCVLNGNYYLSPSCMSEILKRAVSAKKQSQECVCGINSLTDREFQVLTLLGEGFSTREIATQLSLSPKTIQTHRDNLRNKLELDNFSELLRFAIHFHSNPPEINHVLPEEDGTNYAGGGEIKEYHHFAYIYKQSA